jgi:hypothetical protein
MMNFIRKHWRGEYSLPRSYWLHGSLLGLLIGMGAAFLAAMSTDSEGTSYFVPLAVACFVYLNFLLAYGVWSTGGIWRSATRRGGFWGGAAKVMLVIGWLGAISQTVQEVISKKNYRVSATSPPMTLEKQITLAADRMSKTPRSELIDNLSVYVDKLHGDETRPWGRIKDWAILVEDNLCYIYTVYPDGYILRVGVRERDAYYLLFSNVKWIEIKENQQFNLSIRLGNESPWYLTATAVTISHSPLKPLAGILNSGFIAEMASQPTMSVIEGNRLITTLDLTDAKPALQSMQICQEAQNHNPPKGF